MANRVLQQKVLKMKRMRRAYLKKFSTKNTGPMKYPGFFNEKNEWVDMSLRARVKAGSNSLDEYIVNKYRFNPNSNEAIYARHNGLHTDMTPDKEIILAKLNQSRSGAGTLQGETRFVKQDLYDRPNLKRRLYMGGSECFFIEERTTERGSKVYLRSHIYGSRSLAMEHHKREKILWDTVEEIDPPTQADNPLAT